MQNKLSDTITEEPIDVGVGSQFSTVSDADSELRVIVTHESPTSEGALLSQRIPLDSHVRSLKIESHVLPNENDRYVSFEYLATLRRRKAQKLIEKIESLSHRSHEDDFRIWALAPLSHARETAEFLTSSQRRMSQFREGNSAEVFRQIRDSFMAQGYERYRHEDTRDAACTALRLLITNEEVSPDVVDAACDILEDAGLSPCIGLGEIYGKQGESAH